MWTVLSTFRGLNNFARAEAGCVKFKKGWSDKPDCNRWNPFQTLRPTTKNHPKLAVAGGLSFDIIFVPRRRFRRQGKRFQLRVKQWLRMFRGNRNHNNTKPKSCVPQDAAPRIGNAVKPTEI
jgi:hypothetical protein